MDVRLGPDVHTARFAVEVAADSPPRPCLKAGPLFQRHEKFVEDSDQGFNTFV